VIELNGKCALITGSGQGIGKEIAVTLAKAGANIGVSDINLEAAQATADEIAKEFSVKTIALKANVASEDEVKAMVKDFVAEMGSIDILVNNAGITKDGLIMRMKESDWDAVLNVNLKSAFLCTKAASRPMMKTGGRIINIASISGVIGLPGQANYSASKAGMIGMTKAVAKELASKNVTVNAVAPGFIRTAMTDKLSDDVIKGYEDAIPMSRMGVPSDIANTVLFLASDLASYVTGQVVQVNGGLAM
jgi:3-oxoacyl-[acyl-carrier protein] reductase